MTVELEVELMLVEELLEVMPVLGELVLVVT